MRSPSPTVTSGRCAPIAWQPLDIATGLALVPRLLRENNRAAIDVATALASLRSVVPATRLPAYDRWLVATLGPDARKLGWLRKGGSEPLDMQSRRGALVPLVAEAGDAALVREAIKLARTWRELPRDTRPLVLATAIRSDPATFDRILAGALGERDRETRGGLFTALAQTTDAARLQKVLSLMLDASIDFRDVWGMPYEVSREPQRTQVERFVLAALLARYPREVMFNKPAFLAAVFTAACNPSKRDEIAKYVTDTFSKLSGGERIVAQRIEAMDQCIAWKTQAAPQLDRWLAK